MNIEAYRNYCIKKNEVTESFPFPGLPNVLVFKVSGKMFTAIDILSFESISVRCDADEIDELSAKFPAFKKHAYFSERYWTITLMDNTIADKLLLKWIDESYQLAVQKLTKKKRVQLKF
jgi:predicted DNA-binding protein (MmcQ/YjbR family)